MYRLDNLLYSFNDRGSTAEVATQNIIDVQIPALKDLCSSGSLSIDNIDVFCEKGVFDTDASRRILRAGQEAGQEAEWKVNFHGDKLHPMNSGEVNSGYQNMNIGAANCWFYLELAKQNIICYLP